MSAKYYALFVVEEPGCSRSEFSGIIEVLTAPQEVERKDLEHILASNLELDVDDVTVVQWARVH